MGIKPKILPICECNSVQFSLLWSIIVKNITLQLYKLILLRVLVDLDTMEEESHKTSIKLWRWV